MEAISLSGCAPALSYGWSIRGKAAWIVRLTGIARGTCRLHGRVKMRQETLYELTCRVMNKHARRDATAWKSLPCAHAPWLMLIDGVEVPDVQG